MILGVLSMATTIILFILMTYLAFGVYFDNNVVTKRKDKKINTYVILSVVITAIFTITICSIIGSFLLG